MPLQSRGYTILPEIYDRWQKAYGQDYSSLIFPRLQGWLARLGVKPTSMLDLACGTGSLAIMLARRGWKAWGVDGSEGMIEAARRKLHGSPLNVTLLRQDMRRFRIPEKVDLVTCMFDSINHLLGRADLARTFRAVHASLRPGGYFIFDVNNERCFRTLWTRNDAIDHKDFTLILKNSYSPERSLACSQVTLFLKKEQQFERRRELICERYYPPEQVRESLGKAGFRVVKREDFNFTSNPKMGKVKTWWVGRKHDWR